MKRTGVGVLVIATVLGLGAGFLVDQVSTAGGRSTFVPAAILPVLLLMLGALVVGMALPIRRATRGTTPMAPINPFRALRIVMLAKASSIVGAVLCGFGLGLLVFVLTRPVSPSLGSLSTIIATAVCGAVLVVAALIAEHLCTLRKDDDDEQPGAADPGRDADSH